MICDIVILFATKLCVEIRMLMIKMEKVVQTKEAIHKTDIQHLFTC